MHIHKQFWNVLEWLLSHYALEYLLLVSLSYFTFMCPELLIIENAIQTRTNKKGDLLVCAPGKSRRRAGIRVTDPAAQQCYCTFSALLFCSAVRNTSSIYEWITKDWKLSDF